MRLHKDSDVFPCRLFFVYALFVGLIAPKYDALAYVYGKASDRMRQSSSVCAQ
jgi:hypothetical protein